jgi:hypothetical protein
MGVVTHAFNKLRCIFDVNLIQSCNKLPKYKFTNSKAINEAELQLRRLEDRCGMPLHIPLSRKSILSTGLALN